MFLPSEHNALRGTDFQILVHHRNQSRKKGTKCLFNDAVDTFYLVVSSDILEFKVMQVCGTI